MLVFLPTKKQITWLNREGLYVIGSYSGVFPEDLKCHLQKQMLKNFNQWWDNDKYAADSLYLGENTYNWTRDKKDDVIMAQLRAISAVTKN